MITFLTSSPVVEYAWNPRREKLNPANGFTDRLRACWKQGCRCMILPSNPAAHGDNDAMIIFYQQMLREAGLFYSVFELWDDRYMDVAEKVGSYDVIFLGGGHTPTQRFWFESIHLKEKLREFDGILFCISAGAMNAVEEVYAWPEEPGETLDPDYPLFYPGLGYGTCMTLPHYQRVKDKWLDGRRLMEDITCKQSMGRRFLALPDGSYVVVEEDGTETVFGESWLVENGVISLFCRDGESRRW